MRAFLKAILVMPALLAGCAPASGGKRAPPDRVAETRWDLRGIMSLRAPDFHTVTPDGRTNDRAAYP